MGQGDWPALLLRQGSPGEGRDQCAPPGCRMAAGDLLHRTV